MLDRLERSEVVLIAAVCFFAVSGLAGLALDGGGRPGAADPVVVAAVSAGGGDGPTDAVEWFSSVRQHCNPVEVETYLGWQPAPPTPDGRMYAAACYALAGRIARAREAIESLPPGLRPQAADIVFQTGHPAADAGDDIAAGPLMELVVEYWPKHYMALYHAGAARFELGDYQVAEGYLRRFLDVYQVDDGWARNARTMLAKLG